ncbi:MAG: hypothetical protein ACREID_02815, partial [Planctomycetota bacterium]
KQAAALEAAAPARFPLPPDATMEETLVDRGRKARAAGDEERGLALLRVALLRDPGHAGALAFLKEVAPADWAAGDARSWLDWRLEVLPGRVRVISRRHPDMERARQFWRRDLHGFETSEIVLLTNLADPKPVGKCVRLARLTCRALETIFATDKPEREEADPLVIWFFADKKDYEENSGGGTYHGGGGLPLALTLGHYNPADNVSRFYWFDRPDADRTVTETFVHELTHHWIDRRCPRFHFRDMKRAGTDPADPERRVPVPGYWVVEGFAVFMQEGRYDPARDAWSNFNAHAATLDAISALQPGGKLLPWDRVFPLSQEDFASLGKEFNTRVDRRWSIRPAGFSETNLFYYQAGAACHFLYWGEDGAYRERFLDFVTAYYTGDVAKASTQAAFGLSPADLGKKVEEFAKAVMGGWRPAKK